MKEDKDDEGDLSYHMKSIMADLKCPNNYQIKRVCDNVDCQHPALFCIDQECQFCTQNHLNCRSYSFQKFSNLIQKRSIGPLSQFMDKIAIIENNLVNNIQKSKRKISKSFSLQQMSQRIDKKYYKMIQDIYKYKNSQGIKGQQASQLFQQLSSALIQSESREQQLLQAYEIQVQRFAKEYFKIKQWIYDSALGNDKQRKKYQKQKKIHNIQIQSNILNLKNYNLTLQNLINSNNGKISMFAKIIEEQLAKQDRIFLKQSFSTQNLRFQLAFRASDHQFSASKFHQICDRLECNFTILYNQCGKTIGCYTPLTWFGQNIFKADESNASFICSFDEKVKLILSNKNKAIYCSQSLGPTYGGDSLLFQLFNSYDIQIGDKCDKNANSFGSLSHSYQFLQRSTPIENILGVQKNKKFKILDYEVYKVCHLSTE